MGSDLVERDQELDGIRVALDSVLHGDGQTLLVVGDAGIGKTSILSAARDLAEQHDMTVLSARGGKLERDFGYGVVRQLFEPVARRSVGAARARLLGGAAQLAAGVVGLAPDASVHAAAQDATFATNHGLYWLTANLVEQGPVAVVVDDAHWSDAASIAFLHHLGRRLEGLPLLLLIAFRAAEPGAPQDLLQALHELPYVKVSRPSALSEAATGALIAGELDRPADPAYVRACHEVTGGNPFLLMELVHALRAEGMEPTAARVDQVRQLAPSSIAASVLSRLGALGPGALALARAVSVLDTDTPLRIAAALSDLDPVDANDLADELAKAAIFAPGRPVRFAHPIMRQAVYDDLAAGRRASYHARAARLIDTEGGDPDRAAVHLLATEPDGDAWVVSRLRAAAARALARGTPTTAVALTRRALTEPPRPEDMADTLLELGRAERFAGEPSISTLQRALDLCADAPSPARVRVAQELATALSISGRVDEAVDTLERAIAMTDQREEVLALEAQLFGVSQASDVLAARVARRLERVCDDLAGDTAGERLVLAAAVFHRTFTSVGTGAEVAGLARRAWGDGRLLREATGDHFGFYGPLIALRDTDHHDEVLPMLARTAADARDRGSALAVALTLATLAILEALRGDLSQAEASAQIAMDAAGSSAQYHLSLPLAAAALTFALVEQGRLDDAEQMLQRHGLATEAPPTTTTANTFLAARARLRLAQGRASDAVRDTRLWLDRQRSRGGLTAVGPSSILNPALPFLMAGESETASALAAEVLDMAQRWGVTGYTGTCLVTHGLVLGGGPGLEQLRRGVSCLEKSPRRLELARSLVELGAALRRENRRAEARDPLTRGMDLAHHCGATPLAERAHAELRATAARPRKLARTGVESLTAQERRVAEMAAEGLGNRDIAQALFVTRRTIETHLGHVYEKLGISSREQLPDVLPDTAFRG